MVLSLMTTVKSVLSPIYVLLIILVKMAVVVISLIHLMITCVIVLTLAMMGITAQVPMILYNVQ